MALEGRAFPIMIILKAHIRKDSPMEMENIRGKMVWFIKAHFQEGRDQEKGRYLYKIYSDSKENLNMTCQTDTEKFFIRIITNLKEILVREKSMEKGCSIVEVNIKF